MLELISPASSPEGAVAAVQNGADAVYLGFDGITGCREAVNFSDAGFESTVRYCRVRGCKVYLALDILVNDGETAKAGGLALRAQRAGVDAVILRDLGVYRILRRLLPEMPLFAAPEMGFRTPEDAALAAALGFQRLLLPPELSLGEIARMGGRGVALSVMAEGGVCSAESGLCSLSFLSGRGSADRGLCASPCRERCSLGGRWDDTPLSYKDRSLLGSLELLERAGVGSVWIGGREKRPEYAAAFTAVYSRAIREGKLPAESDLERLEAVFSPYGHSQKPEVAVPPEPVPGREAEKLCSEQRKSYTAGSEVRRVPVEFAVVARSERARIRIGVIDQEGNKAILDGPPPVSYGDVPLTDSALREAMYKTAGTPYHCTEVRTAALDGLAVSRTDLDIVRRQLLEKLSAERGKAPHRREGRFPAPPGSEGARETPVFTFRFLSAEQMTPELAAFRPECVYAPLELLAEKPAVLEPFLQQGCAVAAALPPSVCGEREEERLDLLLQRARGAGVFQVLAPSFGLAIRAKQAGMEVRGGAEMGVFNSYAMQNLAAAGFLSAVVSPQLSLRQIRGLAKPLPAEMLVYGRLPAMVTRECLLKASAGRCTCSTAGQLADSRGGVWPVLREFGCRNTVYASRKLFLTDRVKDWTDCGLWGAQLFFTSESPRECLEVARSYIEGTGYRPNGLTHGAYYKGVR